MSKSSKSSKRKSKKKRDTAYYLDLGNKRAEKLEKMFKNMHHFDPVRLFEQIG